MKEKLAPIHFVQHNRIKIQENLETFLIDLFGLQDVDAHLIDIHGPRTSEEALEIQIDHDDIHGWLESHLVANEKRLSMLSREILKSHDEPALLLAHAEYGKRLAESLKEKIQFSNGEQLYGYLNTVMLDGMPCDKINEMVEAGERHLVWKSRRDLHSRYYEEQNLPEGLYPNLRRSFLASFLTSLDVSFFDMDCTENGILYSAHF
ncbi:hypothetical protein J3A84_02430 [Proteiniclasticum sp. SCR006]|uniref:Uncharacterized protein n=1 Tax=Proteiniclasticum aestuarii TaxID=2817862 RepID=A0A939HA82_9CLOT|nr:hypothetical protein [Proteiniclasticum aestuarii]MBO1263900.1 hypothetical protein [Proteiniclasticum aestuarii]